MIYTNLNEKMKNVAKFLWIALGLFFLYGLISLFGISGKSEDFHDELGMPMHEEVQVAPINASRTEMMGEGVAFDAVLDEKSVVAKDNGVIDKKVIKNGFLSLKVVSTEEAAGKIGNIAVQSGGEIFSTNFYERVKGQKSGIMVVKVPVSKFVETMEEIKQVSTQVVSESTTGQDITEQYADLQTQLRNKKAEEESFLKILDKAVKIEDVLATTRELARVRREIETIEGRIKYLDSQADMSTITVDLTEDVTVAPISEDWRIGEVFKEALSDLKEVFRAFINGIIRFIIVGIPSLIPFALLIWLAYWAGRRIMKR